MEKVETETKAQETVKEEIEVGPNEKHIQTDAEEGDFNLEAKEEEIRKIQQQAEELKAELAKQDDEMLIQKLEREILGIEDPKFDVLGMIFSAYGNKDQDKASKSGDFSYQE
jgi:hypothetical protein